MNVKLYKNSFLIKPAVVEYNKQAPEQLLLRSLFYNYSTHL